MFSGIRHEKDELGNGLKLVTVEVPHLHTAALVMYVRAGSRYEAPEENGLSHFVEHMLFRGTARHPSSYALSFAIEELGGTLSAETGRDYSLFQVSLDADLVGQGVRLFADIFGSPAFTQLEIERQMILEEIAEDLDEDGVDVCLDDLARATAYPGHPLGQKITGPASNVERFTIDEVRRHFERHVCGRNMILAVSGPVRRAQVLEDAELALGALPAGEAAVVSPPRELEGGPRFAYVRAPGAQTASQILFRSVPERHPDHVVLQVIGRILDDGMSTRLHYTLCDQLGLAYSVGAWLEPFHDTGLVALEGGASHAKHAELLRRSLGLLGELRDKPVSDAELGKARRRYRYDLAATIDDAEGLAGWYGGTELFYPPLEPEQKIAAVEAVTKDDIQRVARAIFRPEHLVVATAGALSDRQRAEAERVVKAWR